MEGSNSSFGSRCNTKSRRSPRGSGESTTSRAVRGWICSCGVEVVQRTSWTDLNPGRRFLSCYKSRVSLIWFAVVEILELLCGLICFCGDSWFLSTDNVCFVWFSSLLIQPEEQCSFFQWLDPEICPRSKQIIPGLLRRVNELEFELSRRPTGREEEQAIRKSQSMNFRYIFAGILFGIVIGFFLGC